MPPGMLAQVVPRVAEHAHRLVSRQHQLAIVHRDVEYVSLANAERMPQVGRQHDSPERVDAPRAVLRAHVKGVRPNGMRSVL